MAKKVAIKVPPIKVGDIEYKIVDIDLPKKTAILNELMKTKGEPNFDLFVKTLQLGGISDEEILYMDIETTTTIGNSIISVLTSKKKQK